jgi:hypothetical protein
MNQLPFKDISYAQGVYNMSYNTDEIIAIRMSSGDGNLHFDTQATTNYNNAKAAGKVTILYHFAGTADPTTEANFFIEAVSPLAEGDVYALDIEQGQSKAWIETFTERVHAVTGAWPLVYMNISTANSQAPIPNCGLWLAAPSWGFDATITELSSGIEYVAQQGPIVDGVDSDMWFGTLDALKLYGYQIPAVSSPPVSTPTVAPVETAPVVQAPTTAPVVQAPTTAPVVTPSSMVLPELTNNVPTKTTPAPVTPNVVPTPTKNTQKPIAWYKKVLLWLQNLVNKKGK